MDRFIVSIKKRNKRSNKKQNLNIDIGEEILTTTPENTLKIYEKENLIFIILHFPQNVKEESISFGEVDFIVKDNEIITVRYESSEAIFQLKSLLETAKLTNDEELFNTVKTTQDLLLIIIRNMYSVMQDEVRIIREEIEELNNTINGSNKKDIRKQRIKTISDTGEAIKTIIKFRENIEKHKKVIEKFSDLNNLDKTILNKIEKTLIEIKNDLIFSQKLIESSYHVNVTLVQTDQAEIIKYTGMFTIIALPIAIFISVLDLALYNTNYIQSKAFIGLLIVLSAIVISYIVLNLRRWL